MLPRAGHNSLGKIVVIYLVLSTLWSFVSEEFIHYMVDDKGLSVGLTVLADSLVITATALVFYAFMKNNLQALRENERQLQNNYQVLEATHEELLAAEEQLREQLARSRAQQEFYQGIFNGIADGVVLQDVSGRVLFANPAACALLDTTLAALQHSDEGTDVSRFKDEQGRDFSWRHYAAQVLAGDTCAAGMPVLIHRFFPFQRWLYLQSVVVVDMEGSRQVLTTLSDVSPQKFSELKIFLLNGLAQRIMAGQPLTSLYESVCAELVNSVGYPAAFIALKQPGGSVKIVAEAGLGENVRMLQVRWDETPEGHGTVGEAIRSGRPQIDNLQGNVRFRPWWELFEKLNLQSIATFPLKAHGQILGAFVLYAHVPDYFGEFHVSRLQTLAEQIAVAMLTHAEREQIKLQNTALAAAANAILLTDRQGDIIWANQAFSDMTGYPVESVLGQNPRFLRSGRHDTAFYAEMWATITADRIWRGELVNRRADGSTYYEEMTITPVHIDDAEITHFVAVKQDVSARKQYEEALWLEKERAQITLASIGDAVITTGVDGRITYLNPVAEALTGWMNRQAVGLPLLRVFNIIDENTGQIVDNPVIQCLREKRVISLANHTMLIHRDGHAFAIEDSAAPICDREGQVIGAVLVFHDVSDKRNLIRQLFHQAHHDALTDLPNRLLFNDRARQAIAQAQRRSSKVAFLFLDLDNFKLINDTLGHTAGDQLLRSTGERLSSCLREGDTVARQGGDEFLVLLPEVKSENQAAYVAQKILGVLEAPFQLLEQEVYVSASIGIALYPEDGEDVETLIKHADTAMYHAKDQGRNHYRFYTLALNKSLSERLALQNDLRRALDRQEFVLYYQPQFRLSDAQLCGLEALVRWQHPQKGLLLPGEFIPIAEESGLILDLGDWVLREACCQNKLWQDAGYPPVRVAVNLSARQFRQANLVRKVGRILQETGLPAQWLELEITESMSMENFAFSLTMLQELKKMGVNISLDDFGTGFSSLNYLSRFPLDSIKIDRSFIYNLPAQEDGKAIVTSIIQLAKNLGLKVVAEGVETGEQLEFLRWQACDEVQGYFFARPVPKDAVINYFSEKL